MQNQLLLAMRGISKRYPGVVALNNVTFEIAPAEIIGLIGENGAGKSTLMKILGGVVERDGGTIDFDGHPVEIRSPLEASHLGIEFIHQELSVLENLDVAGNIFLRREPTFGGFLKLIDRPTMYAAADAALRRVGLELSSRTMTSELSIAQRQLVEIARCLNAGARLLIMDEPTSSLTLHETQRLMYLVKELKAQGVAVIYISHRLDEVQTLADRVVGLRDGQNAGELSKEEISHDRMVRLMVGRDLKDFYAPAVHADAPRRVDWLSVSNLRTLRYPQHPISFSVAQGEVLGFAGLIGAGRSEIARALFGADPMHEGVIRLDGQVLKLHAPKDAIAAGIYLAPEDRRQSGLVIDFSIRDNITLPALHRYATAGWLDHARESAKAAKMMRAINVKAPAPDVRVGNLSGGNQQKVVLARWLALEPKVLIFDEPTRGIDVGAKAEIYALIRQLAARGVAIIVISSEMEEVLNLSDRLAVMHEGRLTGILNRDECTEEAVMRLATGGGR
jgi:ribose transport system ATP-binding protein